MIETLSHDWRMTWVTTGECDSPRAGRLGTYARCAQ